MLPKCFLNGFSIFVSAGVSFILFLRLLFFGKPLAIAISLPNIVFRTPLKGTLDTVFEIG